MSEVHLVGLTGGIGSGKSTVAGRLVELGAVVIDADQLAREVVEPGTPGLAAVVERFGHAVLRPDGSLDRPALGKLVFGNLEALGDLNAIVHPLVGERMAALMAQTHDGDIVVYDVPLLVENNLQSAYEAVIVVEAPVEVRVERLVDRGLPAEDARARMASQASDEARRAVATVLIDNSGDLASLVEQVDAAWAELTAQWGTRLEPPKSMG